MPLVEVVSSISPMMPTEVAQEGTTSKIHINVAKAKMAMMRCWMTVRFWMPYMSAGAYQRKRVTASTMAA